MYSDAIESLDLCACHRYSRKWPKYFKAQKSNVGGALQYQGPWIDPELSYSLCGVCKSPCICRDSFFPPQKKHAGRRIG